MTLKILKILTLAGLLSTTTIQLSAQEGPKVMNQTKIKQLDRKLTSHKARDRNFNTKFQYKRHKKYIRARQMRGKYLQPYRYNKYMAENHRYHNNGERHFGIPRAYPIEYGHPHPHHKRGWVLAYRYDRAGFYDRDGFYYGYFNHHGYYFEDVFYRYDRFYTFHDRVRGRGLFDRYFYRPAEYRHYGFCN